MKDQTLKTMTFQNILGAKYNVSISSQSNDSVNVVDYAPKNQNEEFQVQNTLGYTFAVTSVSLMVYLVDLTETLLFLKQLTTNKKVTEQL